MFPSPKIVSLNKSHELTLSNPQKDCCQQRNWHIDFSRKKISCPCCGEQLNEFDVLMEAWIELGYVLPTVLNFI
jgi:hypothetical protein